MYLTICIKFLNINSTVAATERQFKRHQSVPKEDRLKFVETVTSTGQDLLNLTWKELYNLEPRAFLRPESSEYMAFDSYRRKINKWMKEFGKPYTASLVITQGTPTGILIRRRQERK